MGMTKVVRSVPSIEPYYFAVRADFARSAIRLSDITEDSLDGIGAKLISVSHRDGRKILVTPYAVATIQYNSDRQIGTLADQVSSHLRLNRNLENFGQASDVLKLSAL
jgi:hypothetical protein